MPSGNKPFPEPVLTNIVNQYIWYYMASLGCSEENRYIAHSGHASLKMSPLSLKFHTENVFRYLLIGHGIWKLAISMPVVTTLSCPYIINIKMRWPFLYKDNPSTWTDYPYIEPDTGSLSSLRLILYCTSKYDVINSETSIMFVYMMTSSNGNIFRVTGHLCGEFTGPRWIPRTKASDAELWCFLSSASE